MLTKTAALEILKDLNDININVVLVAIADPSYSGRIDDDSSVQYTIELNRNINLTSDKIVDIDKVLAEHDSRIELPGMTVVTYEVIKQREARDREIAEAAAASTEPPPAEHGGGTEENVGKIDDGAPQAEPA